MLLLLLLPLLVLLLAFTYECCCRMFVCLPAVTNRLDRPARARVVELALRPGQLSTTSPCDIDGDFRRTRCICTSLDVVSPVTQVRYGVWYAESWWSQKRQPSLLRGGGGRCLLDTDLQLGSGHRDMGDHVSRSIDKTRDKAVIVSELGCLSRLSRSLQARRYPG